MKRIRNNDLTHYFLRDHSELPAAYVKSCQKFFQELGKEVFISKVEVIVNKIKNKSREQQIKWVDWQIDKLQASSLKRQASSDKLTQRQAKNNN